MTPGATIDAAFAGRLGGFDLDVAFTAPATGITAVFGQSGCGKTSVLRCVAGLTRLPGRLRVGGNVWQDDYSGMFLKPYRRPVGYVFQEASLFPHLSVRGNLTYGARRTTNGGANGLVFDDVVELLGIGPLLDRAPDALSGGERQRVAIGRALLARPSLLLMDEPLAALDRFAKEEILPYLEALQDTLALPVLYVSHDMSEVARLASHMIVLNKGRKVAEGEVGGVLERLDLHPATGRFEAGVIVSARVVNHDDDLKITHASLYGQPIDIPLVDAGPDHEIRLRIRARDVSLATERPKGISIRNVIAGTVAEINEEKNTAYAETLVDIGGARIRARITRASVRDLSLTPGSRVYALIKAITFDRRAYAGELR
ncbi:MAG: molybdenum ABC transporter ATP-binding protein [Rhodospirillales bacterium]|nr:molybdenum ABC transporter ATP-binding protein [Rhodospirillales bacterium]MBO6788879.1 molybdenum ABC transporter ATP-binding protein [Rhodospirillales bacterium]